MKFKPTMGILLIMHLSVITRLQIPLESPTQKNMCNLSQTTRSYEFLYRIEIMLTFLTTVLQISDRTSRLASYLNSHGYDSDQSLSGLPGKVLPTALLK